jgi:hypothetical protein
MVGGRYDPDGLHHQLEVMAFYYLAAAIAAIIIAVSGWVLATRMRQRIKKDLGGDRRMMLTSPHLKPG